MSTIFVAQHFNYWSDLNKILGEVEKYVYDKVLEDLAPAEFISKASILLNRPDVPQDYVVVLVLKQATSLHIQVWNGIIKGTSIMGTLMPDT